MIVTACVQTISPCLWFDTQAEEAAKFYASIFRNSKIRQVSHYGESGPGKKGSVMTVAFELDGREFLALNGGPHFKFNEAVSFQVSCETQAEIDHFWSRLSQGGQEAPCGWLKDKYGVSWQIVPTVLGEMMADPDRAKAKRAADAMMKMVKLNIAALKEAYAGTSG